jgi:hypothetical protein
MAVSKVINIPAILFNFNTFAHVKIIQTVGMAIKYTSALA